MACSYRLDLRRRVIEAIDGGLSARAAARRFAIGISTAGSWQWRSTGDLRPGQQGQPKGSKLDTHEAFILELVADNKDIALHEIAGRLAEEHGLQVAPSTVWHFFAKRGITYKKRRRMQRNSSVPTSSPAGRSGSTASPILIRGD